MTLGELLAPNGLIANLLPWVISSLTITHVWLVGNKSLKGWVIALFNQLLWLTWVLVSQTWGLIPLNLVLTAMYLRNYLKWQSATDTSTIKG